MPEVSVIMPVYNVEKYVEEAAKSVLNQSFEDLELIIVNDGSTDRTPDIIDDLNDPRVKIIHQENAGSVPARNRGLKESVGKFIAQHDADDISAPDRIKKQVRFLKEHREIHLVGSFAEVVDTKSGNRTISPRPQTDNQIRRVILKVNPFVNGSVLFKRKVVEQIDLYGHSEDDYLQKVRVLARFKTANIPEILYTRRARPEGMIKGSNFFDHLKRIIGTRKKAIRILDIPAWKWYQVVVPLLGYLLFSLGLNKELGHQIISKVSGGPKVKEP